MRGFAIFDAEPRLPRDYWLSIAPGVERVEVEIGPGDGRFLREAAIASPSTLFVGFEVRAASIGRATKAALPRNARIHHLDGRWVIEHLLATASIHAYHIYFPDPWWKKRHAKRRIVTPDLVAALFLTLEDAGSVYLLTDVETRHREMVGEFAAGGFLVESWERSAGDAAQSSYERKYRAQRRLIYGSRFVKAQPAASARS